MRKGLNAGSAFSLLLVRPSPGSGLVPGTHPDCDAACWRDEIAGPGPSPAGDVQPSELEHVGGAVDQGIDLHRAELGAVHARIGVDVDPAHIDADRGLLA